MALKNQIYNILIEDLANQNLKEVPEKVLSLINLKMLYLEGNDIESIPENLFQNLKQLTWLDLRNNQVKTIPPSIIYHSNLETLLLQNNKITRVPHELGFVPKLNVLQLSGNPITYPDQSIIEKGVKAIVKFLQNEYSAEKLNSISNSVSSSSTFADHSDQNTDQNSAKEIKCILAAKPKKSEKPEMPIITLKSYHRFIRPTRKKEKEKNKKLKKPVKSKAVLYKTNPYSNSNKSINVLPKKKLDARVQEQFMKDLWLKNLKEIMTTQQEELQKEYDKKVLKKWRDNHKAKEIPNVKYRPEVPYDYDPNYDRMPTRQELLLKRIEKAQKQLQHPGKLKKPNIDHMINDIIESLKEMERDKKTKHESPMDGMQEAGREIKRILAIQKRISALKVHNDNSV